MTARELLGDDGVSNGGRTLELVTRRSKPSPRAKLEDRRLSTPGPEGATAADWVAKEEGLAYKAVGTLSGSFGSGDTLVVVVNGDAFLAAKKGRPFQDLRTRALLVSCIREVDYVVPFEIEGDASVNEALRAIRPHVFTKGGDRTASTNIAEWDVCESLGIEVVTGIGLEKAWSSSNFLQDWGEFWASREASGPE